MNLNASAPLPMARARRKAERIIVGVCYVIDGSEG